MRSISLNDRLEKCLTIQERVFVRLSHGVSYYNAFTLENFRKGIRDRDLRQELGHLSISINPSPTYTRDPEIHPALQDLADLIAYEAAFALTANYYPGVPELHVPKRHVPRVMAGLQREMDREASRRGKEPRQYSSLSSERQRALAEWRRYWYEEYGITPRSWKSGYWSLWKVKPLLWEPIHQQMIGMSPT